MHLDHTMPLPLHCNHNRAAHQHALLPAATIYLEKGDHTVGRSSMLSGGHSRTEQVVTATQHVPAMNETRFHAPDVHRRSYTAMVHTTMAATGILKPAINKHATTSWIGWVGVKRQIAVGQSKPLTSACPSCCAACSRRHDGPVETRKVWTRSGAWNTDVMHYVADVSPEMEWCVVSSPLKRCRGVTKTPLRLRLHTHTPP
jgi:hypothetical protein